MPTYEYVCTSCKNGWEEIQKISEDPIQVCPKCGESTAKRQISGGNFILKGGGWYADLYSSSKKPANGASSEASSTSESKSSGGESKTGGGEAKSGGESKSSGGEAKSSTPKSDAK